MHQTRDINGTPGIASDTSSVYINIAGQQHVIGGNGNDLPATLRGAKLDPRSGGGTGKQHSSSQLLGMLQTKKASLAASRSVQNNSKTKPQKTFTHLANNVDT